jgi:hypothetical protein
MLRRSQSFRKTEHITFIEVNAWVTLLSGKQIQFSHILYSLTNLTNNRTKRVCMWLAVVGNLGLTFLSIGETFIACRLQTSETSFSFTFLIRITRNLTHVLIYTFCLSRFQSPHGLRRGSAAVRLLGLWVRIPPEAWMSVPFECCVLSGGGLCTGLISRPEESYWVWAPECHREASIMRRPSPTKGWCVMQTKQSCLTRFFPCVLSALWYIENITCLNCVFHKATYVCNCFFCRQLNPVQKAT